jgi:glycosyltransferase A (GT-A) superfamily protein (DUF2064 family)
MIPTRHGTVIVMAKAPRPGFSKTRLCPPCTPEQAAALAEAALSDTLDTVTACRARRRVLALDGEAGPWLPDRFDIIRQRGDGLDERLANAFDDAAPHAGDRTNPADTAVLLVGMDTPQMTPGLLDRALDLLAEPNTAVLGHAFDGGWWILGLPAPRGGAVAGIPTSTAQTGRLQHRRLIDLGYRIALLPTLRDVDRWPDARVVARLAPTTRFGHLVPTLAA